MWGPLEMLANWPNGSTAGAYHPYFWLLWGCVTAALARVGVALSFVTLDVPARYKNLSPQQPLALQSAHVLCVCV